MLPDLMGDFEADEEPSLRPGDHSSMVIKGKRTKRPRTPSPCGGGATAAVSSSSTSGCGGGGGGGDCDFSLSSDSGSTVIGSTEEEEDMAYCLILLAQGPRRRTGDEVEAETADRELFWSGMKFSKVAAAGSATATRVVFDMYECKTCNRTFPSFQALGGHRASHKKPRVAAEDTKKSSSELNSDEDGEEGKLHKIAMAPPPLSSIPTFPSKLCKPKIHECSICGAGFSSGQALGGHMRRHRAVNGQVNTSLVDSVISDHHHDSRIIVERAVLSLDLNQLPAPENDSKFQFSAAAAPTQNPLLFSAPALVGCHY